MPPGSLVRRPLLAHGIQEFDEYGYLVTESLGRKEAVLEPKNRNRDVATPTKGISPKDFACGDAPSIIVLAIGVFLLSVSSEEHAREGLSICKKVSTRRNRATKSSVPI
ncbi:hypothetical protein CERZMDRAFT_87380 [Cercospora zeae-maydis SCOH1-5]|uniref:Uncharacterized protein n=1 Tax=Cercospora zeae-maydis SCOH1-5 TaxID=717836 RepID=A0A6A6F2T8_9PEZI|nr:hypothetical protein CERZMDRAFT_87380 [Cercospora zeae-maydis SCOH1-5]